MSVVTILPGVIDSNLHDDDVKGFEIPAASRYRAVKYIIASWANGEAQPKDSLPADKFAELVVDDVLGTKNPKGGLLSRGPYAALLRRIGTWAPMWMAVSVIFYGIGFLSRTNTSLIGLRLESKPRS